MGGGSYSPKSNIAGKNSKTRLTIISVFGLAGFTRFLVSRYLYFLGPMHVFPFFRALEFLWWASLKGGG